MVKVIFINTYYLYDRDVPLYDPGTDAFYRYGMGVFIADEMIRRNEPFQFENWRMDLRITEPMEKIVDGIRCRIFPSQKAPFLKEYSKSFVAALKEEAKEGDRVFHFLGIHQRNYQYFARLARKNTIIATHLGGANPYWTFKETKSAKSYLNYLIEKHITLKYFNHFISMSATEVAYFKKLNFPTTHMPIFGIPEEKAFQIVDKIKMREELGLPLDKKILLQVGRAMGNRGFDWIVNLVDHYKDHPDYFLLFVGVHQEDEYFQELEKRGAHIIGYLDRDALVKYYNASDLIYYLPHGKMDLQFAGTSYVPIEAMACGLPVVSTTFHHFPGSEVSEVSRRPESETELIPYIEEVLNTNIPNTRCRELALKYFSWDEILPKYQALYRQ